MSAPAGRGPGRPWHREPLMWLVVGVPALTVVAGFATLVLAARGGDTVVRDDFRSDGLALYADPARDAAASAAGARATLAFDAPARQLRATLSLAQGRLPDRLLVLLSHGARAELDRMTTLRRLHGGAYAGTLDALPDGRWAVELTPPDRGWRLRGEFAGPAALVELRAARAR